MTKSRRIERRFLVTSSVSSDDESEHVSVSVQLHADLNAIVRQLSASALVSKSKPKQASALNGAVLLTVLEESTTET